MVVVAGGAVVFAFAAIGSYLGRASASAGALSSQSRFLFVILFCSTLLNVGALRSVGGSSSSFNPMRNSCNALFQSFLHPSRHFSARIWSSDICMTSRR